MRRLLFGADLARELAAPATMAILAHHDLGAKAVLDQLARLSARASSGMKAQQADPVEADIGAAVDNPPLIGGVGVAAAMADEAAVRANAALGNSSCCSGPAQPSCGVGDDRHAGRLLGDAGGGQELLPISVTLARPSPP